MAIQVVPYTDEWLAGVKTFNQRMQGTGWGYYETTVDLWVPKKGDQKTWREHYLAIENNTDVRGAYALKPHVFHIQGEEKIVTDWQGPVSEGLYDRRYSTLGLRLVRDMLKRYPLLYSWGHGGYEATILEMLRKMGWYIHPTPFCIKVLKPYRFLRQNAYLRKTPTRRLALDLAAVSGLGPLGIHALNAALRFRGQKFPSVSYEVVPKFDTWADTIWNDSVSDYSAIATRDSETMNLLVPEHGWPAGIRLKVQNESGVIGWAVVKVSHMKDDARFGSLTVGSLIDCLAKPESAGLVVKAAMQFLNSEDVDIVVSNQSHEKWIDAFVANGFLTLKGKRFFAASPELQKALEPLDTTLPRLHLTNMDGHGPHSL